MGNYILGPNGDFVSADELYHYGIKGMKWGVRRYQNKDGSLTPAGKKRYTVNEYELTKAFPEDMKTVRKYRKLGDSYRGKAYGTGNLLDGTYRPPKDSSEEAFTANMRKSDEYYRKADTLERDLENRLRKQKLQNDIDGVNGNIGKRSKERIAVREAQELMDDARRVTAKAQPGSHMLVTSTSLSKNYGLANRMSQPAYHLVDDQGNVRLSYIRGDSGDRFIASGKDYIDKLDLNRYFKNVDDWKKDIEYDIYD